MPQLTKGFQAAEAGRLPDPPPTYCFTQSVYDDSLAPAGHHTVYLACPERAVRGRRRLGEPRLGAAEVAGGYRAWRRQGLPTER